MFDQFIIIEWFRENTTGAVEDLGPGDYQQLGNYDRTSRYHKTAFTNQPYSPSLLGKYWCQVINITTYPGQPLMRSNVFTLLAPENYSGPTCILIQEEHNVACADLLLVLSSATQPTSSHDLQPVQPITSQVLITSHSTGQQHFIMFTYQLMILYKSFLFFPHWS